jgi:hypothetical protein
VANFELSRVVFGPEPLWRSFAKLRSRRVPNNERRRIGAGMLAPEFWSRLSPNFVVTNACTSEERRIALKCLLRISLGWLEQLDH